MNLKKILPFTLSFMLLFGCASSESSSDTKETSTESSEINGNYFNLVYDSDEIEKVLAEKIETYFYAVEIQDYDLYESTLYPDYVENMNAFLEENYSYDLQTVLGELNDVLIEDAGAYLDTDAYTSDASYKITSIELSMYESETTTDDDEETETETSPVDQYASLFGDDFVEDVKNYADEILDVNFSIKAICNGNSEEYLLTDNEFVVIKKDSTYYLIG